MDREAASQPGASADGPFAGVPFLIKDLGQDYAGLPTSSGGRARSNVPMPEHATAPAEGERGTWCHSFPCL